MFLQYVGPKPLISAHGVEFDHNKEDKFIYLNFVAELIHALDHEYIEDQSYAYITTLTRDTDALLSLFRSYDPLIDEEIETRRKLVENEIEEEIERAHTNRVLCDEGREVLVKNIELLRKYRIRRSLNKTVYYSAINSLANIIKRGHISYITAPMFPVHMHVFHSVQGVLNKLHPPVDSILDLYEHDGHLHIKIEIIFSH